MMKKEIKITLRAGLLFWVFASIGCLDASLATERDKRSLTSLVERWKGKYTFRLGSDTYFHARKEGSEKISREELVSIYSDFLPRGVKDTAFVYLNAYDAEGRFVIQVYRGNDGKMTESLNEFY